MEVLTNIVRHELERKGVNIEKEAAQTYFWCDVIAFLGKPGFNWEINRIIRI